MTERTTTLIVPSRNRPELLADTVESILAGERLPTEIVVVDQSDSPHPTLGAIGARGGCEVLYEHSPTRGVSAARNVGIEIANHDLLCFTDDDMLAPPSWFGTLVDSLLDAGERAVVTGAVAAADPERPGAFQFSTSRDLEPAVFSGRVARDPLYTGNMAAFRSAFEEVGLFDARFGTGARYPSSGDNEFGFRLLEAGYSIHYVPQAALNHRAWRGPSEYLPLRWSYGIGQGAFYAKHMQRGDRYMLSRMLSAPRYYLPRLPLTLLRDPKRALGQLTFLAGIAAGFVRWKLRER